MRFGATRSQIYDSQKTARAKWEATADHWDDHVRQEFHDNTFEPLDKTVTDVLRAIDQVSVLFTQIRTECEYPGEL
jgi:hypothetical protein